MQALSHRSVGGINNERLEFLGDSILNAVISAQLYQNHSNFDEGTLTRLRARLVNKGTLASLAGEIALGEHLLLGSGELKSGGQRRASILADALEALFGAIYIDSEYEHARSVILHLFAKRLAEPVVQGSLKDYKSLLQEKLQARDIPLPEYQVISIGGQAHKQIFEVSCQIGTYGINAFGVAGNRRAAEQQAAQQALELLLDV